MNWRWKLDKWILNRIWDNYRVAARNLFDSGGKLIRVFRLQTNNEHVRPTDPCVRITVMAKAERDLVKRIPQNRRRPSEPACWTQTIKPAWKLKIKDICFLSQIRRLWVKLNPCFLPIFWKRKFSPTCRRWREHWGKFNVCPFGRTVQENGAEFVEINNRKQREAGLEKNKLLRANILMITGGNTFKLLANLRKSGLDEAIKTVLEERQSCTAGFSAEQ